MHLLNHATQENPAVYGGKRRVAIGKMTTDIPCPDCAEQGITERMDQHIAIRVGHQPLSVRNAYAAKHHGAARAESMNIVTMPDA